MQARNPILVSLLLLCGACATGIASDPDDNSSPRIRVQHLEFKTSVPLSTLERQKLIASLSRVGWKFSTAQPAASTRDMAEELTREAYQDKGYFRVDVSSELVPL